MDRTVTRVIDVKHLIGYMLKQWKVLLGGMFVGLCIFSIVGVVEIKKSQQQPQTPIEKRTKIAVSEMEFANVQGVVDYEILLAEKEAYMSNSVIMKIDPLRKWSCSDVYTVTFCPLSDGVQGELNNDIVSTIQENGNVPEKVSATVAMFSEQSFWECLSNMTEDKMDVGYLREIVSVVAVSGEKYRVTVLHVDAEKTRELGDLVEKCLLEMMNEKKEFEGYDLAIEKGAPIESVDNGLIETQKNAQVQMTGVRDALATRTTALSDNAREYLELYRSAKDQEDYEDGQILEKVTSVTNKVMVISLKSMKSYVLKGIIIGLMCGIIWLTLRYSFHSCVLSGESVQEMFGLRVLNDRNSRLVGEREYQVVVSKIDVNIPEERKAEMAVLLTSSVTDGISKESMDNLEKRMETLGIKVVQSSFMKDEPGEMKKLKQVEQVVLVEQFGKTRLENLAWEVSLCEESNRKIAGIVFV